MSMPANNERNPYGAWFFAAAGGVALVLAAVLLFRTTQAAALGLIAGIALVAVAELWVAAKSHITANALDAAGIGILDATLYSMYARWAIVPLAVAFIGMLVVTAVAVFLARRRDSLFVALLGLIGGFVNAYLLSTTENYPLAVFAWLLALNVGIAWLVIEKRWWLLLALTVVLTAVYEWGWAVQAMTVSMLPVAVAIFVVSAVVATIPLWHRSAKDCPSSYRWLAVAAAHLPLLFAIYVAGQVNYAKQYGLLFAFLLIIDAGLLAVVWRGGPKWLHAAGGIATLIVFIVWFRISFTHAAWPALLVWAVLFIALYLVRVTPFAGLMFAIFVGLGIHETGHWAAIVLTMFVMLAIVIYVAVKRGKPMAAAIAIAVSSVALMTLHPPLWTLVALHAILFAAIFVVASISEQYVLAILAVPFFVAMVITAYSPPTLLLAIAAAPYLLFIAWPLALGARAKASLAPYTAAALASLVLLIIVRTTALTGWVALVESLLMALLLWRTRTFDPREPRITFLLALTLAFSDIAVGSLFPAPWAVTLFAITVALLVWLFLRLRHPLFLVWSVGLAAFVFFRLAFDGNLFTLTWYAAVYLLCGVAMFVAAYLIRLEQPLLQRVFSVICLFELWFLINLVIANVFHSSNGAVVFDFAVSQPAENAVYTVGWAVIATGLLILGYLIRWPAARGAALSLLVAAVFKGFFADLPRLAVPWLTASLAGLGLSVAVVAIVLQRRWVGKSLGLDLPV